MLLFTDLDNTLIYSYRHTISGSMVWVEELNGHPQSFISRRAYDYYRTQSWLNVVPITTRTKKQFERLKEGFSSFEWKDTLICNGSVLLRDGVEDVAWSQESKSLSEPDMPALKEVYELAMRLKGADSIVSALPFMFYVKTDDAPGLFEVLSQRLDNTHVAIYRDSRKVYCIPKTLNKGCAAERYKARFGYEHYLAAGDSEFDIPMLKQAEICLCPEGILDFNAAGKKRICYGLFSDSICDELEKIRNEE